MNSFDLFFADDDGEEQIDMLQRRKELRDSSNPLELDNKTKLFRISKEAFTSILDNISPHLRSQLRSSAVPNIIKLAAVLRFFAEGSYQTGTGTDFNVGLAQPTFSIILKELLDVMESSLCSKYISFEMSEEEKLESKRVFYEKCGIPGIIGCVDGTHIKILAPKKEVQHLFYNRKGFHSLNTMIVCDYKMRIRYINSKYPGSSHDSMVWNLSDLKSKLQNDYETGERNSWILGDCGYPLEPYLLTPYRTAEEGSGQNRFNRQHSKGRNIVERVIGVWKNRFRCILAARQLHYSPEKSTQIINVSAALHNICLAFNIREYEDSLELDDQTLGTQNNEHITDLEQNEEARIIRDRIAHSLQ